MTTSTRTSTGGVVEDDEVPDGVELAVPVGSRVLILGGAHLAVPATTSSEQVAGELARVLHAMTGPGAVVVAGDLFELAAAPVVDVDGVLRAHPRLRDALAAFAAAPEHHLVVMPGTHDADLATDERARRTVEIQLGARVARAADLVVATGTGERRVRVEPDGASLVGATGTDVETNRDRNAAARRRAVDLLGQGYGGLVSGHTGEPELSDLGRGFYANVGALGEVIEQRRGRFGLPNAHAVGRRLSWLELAAGPDLSAQLRWGRQALPTTTAFQRLVTRPVTGGEPRPVVVAEWPDGPGWPERRVGPQASRVRIRRQAAVVLGVVGLVDLLSALTPPLAANLRLVTDILPIEVPQTAAALVVLAGISLLMLSRGVRRGQRRAWILAVVVLAATGLLHLAKGLDVAESVGSLAVAAYLGAKREHFRAQVDDRSARRSAALLVQGGVFAILTALVVVLVFGGRDRPSLGDAFLAVVERLVGLSSVDLSNRIDRFLQPALLATTLGLAGAAGWLLFRPVLAKTLEARPPEALEAARRIVAGTRGDTLAYFALRDDKRFWFHGDSMVAYAVINGVALVSPDPLGPVSERHDVWDGFVAFADDHGWSVAVMGAGEDWLGIYRAAGMHDVYVGDEAVVDVRRFDLAGGRNKGLRQAVNRVAKKGYRSEFHDPAAIAPELEAKLRALMTESRRGEVERGFSMTLGRIFDPEDRDLLLTVCFGPDDEPVAFCQYVPAPAIDGYSLDLMRRSERDHPNGLSDFVVVETIRHLHEAGRVGLGLNFATMRAVLAGERGDTTMGHIQQWALKRMGDSMQIESLWRFNAKFDPDWVPRYAVYSAPEHLITAALAVAEAESFWELPVIGRFLKPKAKTVAPPLPARQDNPEDPPLSSETN